MIVLQTELIFEPLFSEKLTAAFDRYHLVD